MRIKRLTTRKRSGTCVHPSRSRLRTGPRRRGNPDGSARTRSAPSSATPGDLVSTGRWLRAAAASRLLRQRFRSPRGLDGAFPRRPPPCPRLRRTPVACPASCLPEPGQVRRRRPRSAVDARDPRRVSTRLRLRHAGERDLRIAWELAGPPNAGGDRRRRHLRAPTRLQRPEFPETGWWEEQNGAGIDLRRASASSRSTVWAPTALDAVIATKRRPGRRPRQAGARRAGHRPRRRIRRQFHGAMVGLQFARAIRTRRRQLLAISGAPRILHSERVACACSAEAVALGQLVRRRQGLALARQLAMLTTARRGIRRTLRRRRGALVDNRGPRRRRRLPLEHCAATWVARTSPTAFLRLSESIDLHRVDPPAPWRYRPPWSRSRRSPRAASKTSPRWPKGCHGARCRVLRSKVSHDAFLDRAIAGLVRRTLDTAAFDACGPVRHEREHLRRRPRRSRPRARDPPPGARRHRQRPRVRRRHPADGCRRISAFAGFGEKRNMTGYTRSGNPTRDLLAKRWGRTRRRGGGGHLHRHVRDHLLLHALCWRRGDRRWCRTTRTAAAGGLFNALRTRARSSCPPSISPIRARWPSAGAAGRGLDRETPSNPLPHHRPALRDRRRSTAGALAVVDNTFLSPGAQTPIEFAAPTRRPFHHQVSSTGHSDVVGGAVVAKTAGTPAADVVGERAGYHRFAVRQFPRCVACTLDARLRVHQKTTHGDRRAAQTIRRCANCTTPGWPRIRATRSPRASRRGYGAMLSLELKAARPRSAPSMACSCFTLAESLGGVEAVAHPATMTYGDDRRSAPCWHLRRLVRCPVLASGTPTTLVAIIMRHALDRAAAADRLCASAETGHAMNAAVAPAQIAGHL